MSRMRLNAAGSKRYFVPRDSATIVSTTALQNDGSPKGFLAKPTRVTQERTSIPRSACMHLPPNLWVERGLSWSRVRSRWTSRLAAVRTDGDWKSGDVPGHGTGHASERDGFISGLIPRPPLWAMQRKVTFPPRRFLKKIWQLGNFDVSPDGRLLAFAANKGDQWSVYLLDLRTKKDRILLQSEQSVLNPEFSPDGRWIAVQSDFEGDENYNIYLVPARGAHVQKITDTPFDSAFPRWSPDGTKIAFLSNRDGDRDNVFVVDTGGSHARQLTNVDDIVGEIPWRPAGD